MFNVTSEYIDALNDKGLTIENAKKVYFSVHKYCNVINNCNDCIFNVCIRKELSKLYKDYLESVAKLFGIECDKPFRIRHITHVQKEVRESLERLEFILYEDEGIMSGDYNFDELLDYLLSGKFAVIKEHTTV